MKSDLAQAVNDSLTKALAYGIAADLALATGNLESLKRWGDAQDKELDTVQNLLEREVNEGEKD